MNVESTAYPALLHELSQRPLTDIAIELEALRLDNARLKEEAARLQEELLVLRPEIVRVKQELRLFRASTKSLMQESGLLRSTVGKTVRFLDSMPPEILLRIFRATMPQYHEHDPSVMRPWGPWSDELRFRTGLVRVCKAWLWPATAVLYEDIVFRRMGQICALAHTLSTNPERCLATLIQHIRMDSCVIWASCTRSVKEDLSYILHQCVALRSFSFHPHPNFPVVDGPVDSPAEGGHPDAWAGFNPNWFVENRMNDVGRALEERVSAGLRELDISMSLSESQVIHLHELLQSAKLLKSLKIGPITVQGNLQDSNIKQTSLRLPSLTELYIFTGHHSFVELICSSWHMPSLTHLTALHCQSLPVDLLKAHGERLTYLHIYPQKKPGVYNYSWLPCTVAHLDDIPRLCPVLEHLVFPSTLPEQSSSVILSHLRSPTLRYLDLWCHECGASKVIVEHECKNSSDTLPSLLGIRHLRKITIPDLPLACPPTLVSGDEVRLHRFPGFYVVQTSWALVPDSGTQNDVPWFVHLAEEEADDSSTFRSDTDDDDEVGDENEGSEPSEGAPYDPSDQEIESQQSEEESSDSDYDSESDAFITYSEFGDGFALRDARVIEQFDRAAILQILESIPRSNDDRDTSAVAGGDDMEES